jgi:uncharacterized protein (DUF1501 family)
MSEAIAPLGTAAPFSCPDLDQGDLKMTVDFRQVYVAVLRDWRNVAPESV